MRVIMLIIRTETAINYILLLPPVFFIFNVIFLSDYDIVNILSVLL